MGTKGTILNLIREDVRTYTGRPVTAVEAVQDPHVDGVWAVRVTFRRRSRSEFLWSYIGQDASPEDRIEEVEFESWPPTSTLH